MKLKTHYSTLLLLITILAFSSCGNVNSENSPEDTKEDQESTQIEGFLPPVMSFYEVDLQEDGQTVLNTSESTFKIIKDKENYWAEWKYERGEQVEKIQIITEKTPGSSYAFQTESESGSTTYIISKVDDKGVWSMENSTNNHFGYLYDAAAVDQEENSNL